MVLASLPEGLKKLDASTSTSSVSRTLPTPNLHSATLVSSNTDDFTPATLANTLQTAIYQYPGHLSSLFLDDFSSSLASPAISSTASDCSGHSASSLSKSQLSPFLASKVLTHALAMESPTLPTAFLAVRENPRWEDWTVSILRHNGRGGEDVVGVMSRSVAITYCHSIYTFCNSDPRAGYIGYGRVVGENDRQIHIPNGSPDGFRLVINAINAGPREIPSKKGSGMPPIRDLIIDVSHLSTEKAVAVWEVCHILRLWNTGAQNRLGDKLNYDLSHANITPELFKSVMKVFSQFRGDPRKERNRIYKTAIHQMAWKYVHNEYTAEQMVKIMGAVNEVGGLAKVDFNEKVLVLADRLATHKAFQEQNKLKKGKGKGGAPTVSGG